MFVIIGSIIVIISVFGGFALEGGEMHVLFQPIELLIIGGAALGSLVISAPPPLIKRIIKQVLGTLKGSKASQENYIQLLVCLFEIFKMMKTNAVGLEPHVESPGTSELFKKYPGVTSNHHALHFLCDTLKVQISANLSAYDLEDLMDTDINAMHQEEHEAPTTITRVGDAMPGLGIVAAVLGVVITMGKLTQGKEVIGHSVAAALVGTFLGILLSYGFFQPLAAKMEANIAEEGKFIEVIKVGMLAMAKGAPAKVNVEFARRTIPPEVRPDFETVDKATSGKAA